MKLEVKHLAPYLPYGLKVVSNELVPGKEYEMVVSNHTVSFDGGLTIADVLLQRAKPVLKPLSELTEEIKHNGEIFVPIDWLESKYYTQSLHKECERLLEEEGFMWINHMSHLLILHLIEWHFDIFGLIPAGLAITHP